MVTGNSAAGSFAEERLAARQFSCGKFVACFFPKQSVRTTKQLCGKTYRRETAHGKIS